jgi:hypothetical protein
MSTTKGINEMEHIRQRISQGIACIGKSVLYVVDCWAMTPSAKLVELVFEVG